MKPQSVWRKIELPSVVSKELISMIHSTSFPQFLSGNPWFDKLTMTNCVTLSLSKGGCPTKDFGHDDHSRVFTYELIGKLTHRRNK